MLCSPTACTDDIACSTLSQCIQEGVRYLMRMLQVRNSVKPNDGVVLHDTATGNVLSEGKRVMTSCRNIASAGKFPIKLISQTPGFHQASSLTRTSWRWCTSGKCASGRSSTRTAALIPQSAKKTASNSGTSGHRSLTNTWWPARAPCRAKVGTQRTPRRFWAFYSEWCCSPCRPQAQIWRQYLIVSSPKKRKNIGAQQAGRWYCWYEGRMTGGGTVRGIVWRD